jgi:CBS-domain-containing membrane protein
MAPITPTPRPLEVSDQDVLLAMQEFQGYLDITPGDFKELYIKAFHHALSRLGASRRAEEIMTSQVVWVGLDAPLPQVAQLMADRGVSGVPVLDQGQKIAGIISNRDFLRLMGGEQVHSLMGLAAQCLSSQGCLVSHLREHSAHDIMSAPAVCVGPEANLSQMAQLMSQHAVNRLPVVDAQGNLLGIVSRADLLRATAGA